MLTKYSIVKLLWACALVAAASVPARAEIITFDGLPGTNMAGNSIVGGTYTGFAANTQATLGDFQFSSSGTEFFLGATYAQVCCAGDFGPLAYNGTDYLIGVPDITVSRVGGGVFALKGFDLAEWDNTFTASISLTTAGPSGTTTEVLPLSILGNSSINSGNDFAHFSLAGYDNVLSFTLTGSVSWAYIAMDNLEVVSSVPEPETYAMMLAGLGLLGFAARRRKQKEAAAA